MEMRDPSPPVSAPPVPRALDGEAGYKYGIQNRAEWAPGDNRLKAVIDAQRAVMLWRFSVFGPVLIDLTYGSAMRRVFTELAAPVVMAVPGQCQVYARPADPNHTGVVCLVTLTAATGAARAEARRAIDAGAGPALSLDIDAVRYVALTASALTISGIATAVPALSSVPLVAGSVLNTGSGFQEFEA
jgi:hypothetical protein